MGSIATASWFAVGVAVEGFATLTREGITVAVLMGNYRQDAGCLDGKLWIRVLYKIYQSVLWLWVQKLAVYTVH